MNFNKLFSLVEHPEFFGNVNLGGPALQHIVGETRDEFLIEKQE